MKPHVHAEVLRAIADGKKYQYQTCDGEWSDAWDANPINQPTWEWRIKPEPKPDFVRYCSIFDISGYETPANHTNVAVTFDGETNQPKSVELVK